MPKARLSVASRWSSSSAAFRSCSRRVLRSGLDRRRLILVPPAARRLCRHHAVQLSAMVPMWMHPVAIATGNTETVPPSERDPSASNLIAELYAEAGLLDGVFNVVHGTRLVDALLDHPEVAVSCSLARLRSPSTCMKRATQQGKRVQLWAVPITTPSCSPTPTWTSRRASSPPPGSAPRASAAWRSQSLLPVGARRSPLVERLEAGRGARGSRRSGV